MLHIFPYQSYRIHLEPQGAEKLGVTIYDKRGVAVHRFALSDEDATGVRVWSAGGGVKRGYKSQEEMVGRAVGQAKEWADRDTALEELVKEVVRRESSAHNS